MTQYKMRTKCPQKAKHPPIKHTLWGLNPREVGFTGCNKQVNLFIFDCGDLGYVPKNKKCPLKDGTERI